jgi:tetratricopeptide (TPR) repeat protein
MQLIPAKCPDCGADIKIPEGSTSIVCEYCGGNILVADLLGSTSVMQNCMTLAFSAMESGNYKDAYDHFNRAIEIDLKNPNAWFGKAVSTGMTGKFSDDVYGKMISLFESAFNYTPADKVSNLKKNAAAEIVKILQKSKRKIQLGCELLSFADDKEFSSEISGEINKLKQSVTNTVQKANEYDPENKDVTALLDEINSGKFFTSEKESQNDAQGILKSGEYKSLSVESDAPPLGSTNQPAAQTGRSKKSGCSMVLVILLIILTSTGLLLEFISHVKL